MLLLTQPSMQPACKAATKDVPVAVVMDYDPSTSETLAEILGDEGWAVHSFTSLPNIKQIQQLCPTLMVLELSPFHPSEVIGLVMELRANPVTARIAVVLSCTDIKLLAVFTNLLGWLHCSLLAKPFAIDDLLELVIYQPA